MATQLIAAGSTAANSSDIVIADGESVTVALKGYVSGAEVIISLKDDVPAYNEVARLNPQVPALVISGPGTYRLSRVAGFTCGAFSG